MGLCTSREVATSSSSSSSSVSVRIDDTTTTTLVVRGGIEEEEDDDDDVVHRISGRYFLNASTDTACLFTQQGRKGPNQDAMLLWENFNSRSDTTFCGVFDGHGPYGHMVAKRVRDSLPLKLCTQWKANSISRERKSSVTGSMDSEEATSLNMDDEWCESSDADENKQLPEMYLPLKQSFLKAFKLMDKELKLHPLIDCLCSGSTAVTLLKQGPDIVIGNVGDSRAILGTRDKDNTLISVQLTVDLKPNLPREAARIRQCKGRVFALHDEPEVPRVWLPNNDSPGLAMARAFGDFCLKDFGLISVPDVSYRRLTERDEFIVLATDGVLDVLSNKQVVDIVASSPSRTTAARAIVESAVRAWRLKFPTSKCDDCAAVCLFVGDGHPSKSSQTEEGAASMISDAKTIGSTNIDKQVPYVECRLANSHHVEEHSNTFQGCSDEIVVVSYPKEERCNSARSLAECISTRDDEEWSALEGVTRVNSLLKLPRF
ncbi:hypothetical protein GIB67_039984 [Kingdonia uniflora]|uniref:protein-serine/threonine phosphatase n=1 Tax=Kingdonia uniflora TaxID=39325 RepID=A0A7J7LI14_9MAGN|nr:hypothetical protein GIB67_039984 [Kingdonia uniflora]